MRAPLCVLKGIYEFIPEAARGQGEDRGREAASWPRGSFTRGTGKHWDSQRQVLFSSLNERRQEDKPPELPVGIDL